MNSKLIAKYWLDIFIYLSLILLIFYLAKSDILFFPEIYSTGCLFFSLLLLIAGFLSEMFAWYYLLREYGIKPRPITYLLAVDCDFGQVHAEKSDCSRQSKSSCR